MISSQLVLIAFVVFWLFQQYKKEEKQLKKELSLQYFTLQNKAYDSLLRTFIVNPILKDSLKIKVKKEKFSGKQNSSQKQIIKYDFTTGKDAKLIKDSDFVFLSEKPDVKVVESDSSAFFVNVDVETKLNDSNYTEEKIHIISKKHEQVLVRSVKMIVENSEFDARGEHKEVFEFKKKLDSTKVKELLKRELKGKNYNYNFVWTAKPDTLVRQNPGFFIKTEFEELPGINITNYRSELLKKISPEISFALFLLSLSAFAFYFSFRNFKNQYQLNALKNDFISNITHELKTPVSTIMLALENLKSPDIRESEKQTNDYLNIMWDETKRLNHMIFKVLNQTKLENKKHIIKSENANLSELIFKVIKSAGLLIEKNSILVKTEKIQPDVWLDIDKTYIFGVVFNLLDNAVKYAGKGSEIVFSLQKKEKAVILKVADNGPGFPEEYKNKLFEKFFRVPQNDKHNVKGYGLGLNYAKLVMQQHGGTISVTNLKQGGCEFILTFPTELE